MCEGLKNSLREEERIEEWRKQTEHYLPEIVEHDPLQEHIDTEIADGIAKAESRDSAIVDMMVANNNESAAFLRWTASELMQRPDWSKSAEGKQALSDRIRDRISKDEQNRKESK